MESATGDFMLSIRKDILSGGAAKHAQLKPEDFRHIETAELLNILCARNRDVPSK